MFLLQCDVSCMAGVRRVVVFEMFCCCSVLLLQCVVDQWASARKASDSLNACACLYVCDIGLVMCVCMYIYVRVCMYACE